MGANQSSSMTDATNIVQTSVTNIVNKQSQSTSTNAANAQSIKINIGTSTGCSITSNQLINSSNVTDAISNLNTTSNISTMMQAAVSASVASLQSSKNGFLALAFNNQESNEDIENNLNTTIEANVTDENSASLIAIATNVQNGLFEIGSITCTPGQQGLVIDQTMVLKEYAKQVTGLISKVLMKNASIASAISKESSSQTSVNKGLGSIFSAMMMFYLIIGILLIGAVIFLPKMLGISPKQLLTNKWFIIAVVVLIVLIVVVTVLHRKK